MNVPTVSTDTAIRLAGVWVWIADRAVHLVAFTVLGIWALLVAGIVLPEPLGMAVAKTGMNVILVVLGGAVLALGTVTAILLAFGPELPEQCGDEA